MPIRVDSMIRLLFALEQLNKRTWPFVTDTIVVNSAIFFRFGNVYSEHP